ncbi:hypothetical protein N9954_04965 [Maribacter sp.]|nr:hypothetical protein [Maribacter sp.]
MKRRITLLACLTLGMMSIAQSTKVAGIDEALKAVVYDILDLAAEQNIAELDKKYVYEPYGVYDVFRIGVPDTFKSHNSLGFAFPTETYSSVYPNLSEVTSETSEQAFMRYNAAYDCNEMEWDKNGLFVTDSLSYPKLSELIQQPVFETSEFPESFHLQAKYIEENSYRVVVTEFDIIFYLTHIEGRWYLTLFDRVTTDCSA